MVVRDEKVEHQEEQQQEDSFLSTLNQRIFGLTTVVGWGFGACDGWTLKGHFEGKGRRAGLDM